MRNRTRTWLRAATTIGATVACAAGLVVAAQGAAAAGTATDCTGGTWQKPTTLATGTYDGLTVSGICEVAAGATVTVNGDVSVAVDDTGQGVFFAMNSNTTSINGNVTVGEGAILALGCTPQDGCDGTKNNPPADDTVTGNITATKAKSMYLLGTTIKGDTSFSDGGWGRTCTDPDANSPDDALGHSLVIKDNTFLGSVTVQNWAGCWFGFIRNRVTGSATFTGNYSNPDNIVAPGTKDEEKQGLNSTLIVTNTIAGDLACSGNTPAAQIGQSGGSVNLVHGKVSGECATISVPTATLCTAAPFKDVAATDTFCGDIAWLSGKKIAGGYSDGGFHPGASVTRQAMAAFLYRLANPGQTAPACEHELGSNGEFKTPLFDDVPTGHPFCAEILWLVNNKITTGYDEGDHFDFHPAAPISRQAMAAFLYRLEHSGKDAPACTKAPFRDVSATNTFCGAISWLVGQNVTGGYNDGGFHPTAPITRQAMAAFLYRVSVASAT